MRLPSVPSTSVVDQLNTTYFRRVWNDTTDSGRANFALQKVSKHVDTGAVPIGRSVVGLPTTDSVYAVYRAYPSLFGRFISFPDSKWVKDTDLFGVHQVSIVTYGTSGRLCPYGSVYLRFDPYRDEVLIAIPYGITTKCIGDAYPDMWMTVYKDTTRATPVVSATYTAGTGNTAVPVTTIGTAIATARSTYPKGTLITINGWSYDAFSYPTIVNGDIVNVTSDPDIVGYVDVTVDDNITGYYSELYGEYRELLHIPKAINPNNIIVTNDNLTTLVFDTATGKGVLGHRIDDDAIESITHNDFSMGRLALNGFSNSLQALNIKVRLYVRFSADPNYLTEDVNHIKDLYSLSDQEIANQLLGRSTSQIAEWQASKLEQSEFLTLLYRFNNFNTDTVLTEFVDAMGYYDVASVLGSQMRFYTYKNSQVIIKKPVRLANTFCDVLVYANGRKVLENEYEIEDWGSSYFKLGFVYQSSVKIGDRIAVYVTEQSRTTPIEFTPTQDAPSITLEHEDHVFFKVFDYTESPVASWRDPVVYGYKEIPVSPSDYTVSPSQDGKFVYTFNHVHFDESLFALPRFGLDTAIYGLYDYIVGAIPIVISLKATKEDGNLYPVLGARTIEAYLNGYRLTEGLDYVVKPILGPNGDILEQLLTVSTNDYFVAEPISNLLEVVCHHDRVVSEDKGYAIENKLYRTEPPMIWTPRSSRVFVGGVLQESIVESGNIVVVGKPVPNGAPFLMQYTIPFGVEKLLTGISPNTDLSLRGRIEHVLGIIPPSYSDVVTVDHLHALYSPFLAQITSEVASGHLKITDEPTDDRFVKQFSAYSYLLERDPVIGKNPLVDRRFVTLAAHYVNLPIQDPKQMVLLQRLISLTLTPGELSILDVLL